MANATWPVGLPVLPMFGFKIAPMPNVVVNETAEGPPEVRRRGTKGREKHTTAIELTGTEKATFDQFFRESLADGVLDFEMDDISYSSGSRTAVYNFLGVYPELTQSIYSPDKTKQRFQGSISLEYKGLA